MAEPIIKLTEAASERIKALMARSEDPVLGLRVGITTKGCSGLSYKIEYAHEKKAFEEKVEQDGATLFIDPTAIMFLIGSEMDWKEDKFQTGFTFTNPNETGRCGCGESFHVGA